MLVVLFTWAAIPDDIRITSFPLQSEDVDDQNLHTISGWLV